MSEPLPLPTPFAAAAHEGAEMQESSRPRRSAPRRSNHHEQEVLVAIRSRVEGANLQNVCLVIDGMPYAPSGTALIRPGDTSSMIDLSACAPGAKGAVYFELGTGAYRIALITDELFDIAPGAICVITIADHTRAHNAPIEVEGAVARLGLRRSPNSGS
jgi:hypothetical protein